MFLEYKKMSLRGPSGKCSNPVCSQRAAYACSKTGMRYCGEQCRRQCQTKPTTTSLVFQGMATKSPIQQTVINVKTPPSPPASVAEKPASVSIGQPAAQCGVLSPKPGQTQMTFSATGEEEVSPDKAVLKFVLVSKSHHNDKRAMDDHMKRKNAFSQAIARHLPTDNVAGDAELDTGVKSEDFTLTPVMDYEAKPPRVLEYLYKSDVVVVFQARHFAALSQFVTALTAGGHGVFVEHVTFVSKDEYTVARERATRSAKEGAEACARAIGYGLLEIVKIEYEDDRYGGGGGGGAVYAMAPRSLSRAESASAPSEEGPVVMSLQPGKKLLRSTCVMTVLLGQT